MVKQKVLNFKFEKSVLERTVSKISSDPPCEEGNARFTKVPFKRLIN